jgi:hypothetical protein
VANAGYLASNRSALAEHRGREPVSTEDMLHLNVMDNEQIAHGGTNAIR